MAIRCGQDQIKRGTYLRARRGFQLQGIRKLASRARLTGPGLSLPPAGAVCLDVRQRIQLARSQLTVAIGQLNQQLRGMGLCAYLHIRLCSRRLPLWPATKASACRPSQQAQRLGV